MTDGAVWVSGYVFAAATVREQLRITGRAQHDVHVSLHDVENREITIMTVT